MKKFRDRGTFKDMQTERERGEIDKREEGRGGRESSQTDTKADREGIRHTRRHADRH